MTKHLYCRSTVLENGIRIVTEPLRGARSLSLGVLVDAGPRDENDEQLGLAHLCEHLMFQGTSGRSALEIARLMDAAGGYVGGFTTRDYTLYSATVLDDFRTYAVDILGDVLLYSTFEERHLEREKDAIRCEIEASKDTPQRLAIQLLKGELWRGHYLGRSVAGDVHSVARFDREDVIYFVHEHYSPDRIAIAASGSVEHDDFVANVRDAFWRMLGERPAVEPPAPTPRHALAVESRDLAQAYFAFGIPAPAYADPARYGMHLVANALGGGVSSRLFRALREERGLVYHIDASYHAYRAAGMLVVEGSTVPEKLTEVTELSLGILSSWMEGIEPVGSEELARAKQQLRARHLIASEDSGTRMSRLLTQTHYFGEILPDRAVLGAIDAVDESGLARLASQTEQAARRSTGLAVVGPFDRRGRDLSRIEEILGCLCTSRPEQTTPTNLKEVAS